MVFLRWTFKLFGIAVAFITVGEMAGAWGQLGVIRPAAGQEHIVRVIILGAAAAVLYAVGSACKPSRRVRW